MSRTSRPQRVSSSPLQPPSKCISRADLLEKKQEWSASGRTVVFTNGCFDLFHEGHQHTLDEAAKLGDVLVVGLNSDDSVHRLKGNGRPVDDLETRVSNLSLRAVVDSVVVFEEDAPTKLIEALEPDILVKGGDYHVDEVVGREIVERAGGKVIIVSYLDGISTTNRIRPKP